jgi:hypothetical protein
MMEDPYIDTDGNSYEKAAILEWLSNKSISPITRRPLAASSLVPNRVLKTLIEEFNSVCAMSAAPVPVPVDVVDIPSTLGRKPLILFAVIDNSGSMGKLFLNYISITI